MMMKRNTVWLPLFIVLVGSTLVPGCGPGVPEWRREVAPATGPEITPQGVQFSIYAPRAKRVNIAGDFNNWSKTADPLYDREGSGLWTIKIPLPPGHYEYKFVIDGEKWIPDPGNPEEVDDSFGGLNSVLIVK